jgi:hypothetical protein
LLPHSGSDDNESYDYVLVFINPFNADDESAKSYTRKEIAEVYLSAFRFFGVDDENTEENKLEEEDRKKAKQSKFE